MRIVVFLSCCAALAACHPPEYSLELAKVEHTPLAFDPTEEYDIGRWWFNGTQLLRLDASGGYTLYPGPNRFHDPVERGFWSQQSFAVLRFAPYQTSPEWNRVAVTKNDGAIALHVPRLDPMYSIPGPPEVVEDQLVGIWVGSGATLRLEESGRFAYAPAMIVDGLRDVPSIAVGHHGIWRLAGERVRLTPDPSNLDPYDAGLERGTDRRGITGLEVSGIHFRRASDT